MQLVPKIFKDTSSILADNFARAIISFLVLGIFARELTERDFANLTLWLTNVGLGAQVVVMGTNTLFFSRVLKNKKIIANFIAKIMLIRIAILCVISIALSLAFIFLDDNILFLFPMLLIAALIIESTNIFKEEALIKGKSSKILLSGIGQLLTALCCIGFLLYYQSWKLSYAILIIVFSRLVGATLYYEFISIFSRNISRTLKINFSYHLNSVIFIRSARLMISMLLCSLSFSLPLYYLSFIELHQNASFYGASMRLILLMFLVPSIFSNVLFLYYSSLFKLKVSYALFLIIFFSVVYFAIIIPFLIIFGEALFELVYGAQYIAAAQSFVLLSAVFLFHSLRAGYSKVLISNGIDIVLIKQSILIFLVTLIMIVISNYFALISLAFYSTLIGEFIGLIYVFRRRESRRAIIYSV
ncbi:hypothetical protein N9J60_00625 [Alphaproteobacteria bacterium]|nr:hypothetical protein [Alphaproteobacteria bacterium]